MLELNWTLLFQIVAYFILLYLLNKLLFRPVFKVMDERRERTEGTLKDADDIEKGVEKGLAAYKNRIRDETVKAQEARTAIKKEAFEKEKEILEAARKDAQKEISRIRAELEDSKAAAMATLKKEAKELSSNIAEKVLERRLASVVIAVALPLLPSIAFGSTGGEQGNAGMSWKIFNFILLAAAFYIVWKKWIKGFLNQRSFDIRDSIAGAEKTRKEAEAKLKEYKQKLALVDKKVEQIHTDLRIEAEEEKKRILEEAENASLKIGRQAKLAARQEIKKAKIELQKEVARLAVEMAEGILAREIKPADQRRLVKDYVGKLTLG
jgi:F-type H+-transporting ATPase subunit b